MGHVQTDSVEYYRYLEQDERVLAALAKSEEAKRAHLQFADQYRELARIAELAGSEATKAA